MIRTRYLVLGVEVEGDGPIDAVFLGPDTGKLQRVYLERPGAAHYWGVTWGYAEHELLKHTQRPLLAQERLVRQILKLKKNELEWVGYWCTVCGMFHPSDPKKLTTCRTCKTLKCPAAGCRCKGGP